jgi:hypothetical protein
MEALDFFITPGSPINHIVVVAAAQVPQYYFVLDFPPIQDG